MAELLFTETDMLSLPVENLFVLAAGLRMFVLLLHRLMLLVFCLCLCLEDLVSGGCVLSRKKGGENGGVKIGCSVLRQSEGWNFDLRRV